MATHRLLLVFAACVAGGVGLPARLQAQPSHPRSGVWVGTNATGTVLRVEENNENPKDGPKLRGSVSGPSGSNALVVADFDYGDNRLRAAYVVGGKTNWLEVEYKSGNETNGTVTAIWDGSVVIFKEINHAVVQTEKPVVRAVLQAPPLPGVALHDHSEKLPQVRDRNH